MCSFYEIFSDRGWRLIFFGGVVVVLIYEWIEIYFFGVGGMWGANIHEEDLKLNIFFYFFCWKVRVELFGWGRVIFLFVSILNVKS